MRDNERLVEGMKKKERYLLIMMNLKKKIKRIVVEKRKAGLKKHTLIIPFVLHKLKPPMAVISTLFTPC